MCVCVRACVRVCVCVRACVSSEGPGEVAHKLRLCADSSGPWLFACAISDMYVPFSQLAWAHDHMTHTRHEGMIKPIYTQRQ